MRCVLCGQVTLILKLVAALLKDEGGRTPLHEIARRRCMQVRERASSCLTLPVVYARRRRADS